MQKPRFAHVQKPRFAPGGVHPIDAAKRTFGSSVLRDWCRGAGQQRLSPDELAKERWLKEFETWLFSFFLFGGRD